MIYDMEDHKRADDQEHDAIVRWLSFLPAEYRANVRAVDCDDIDHAVRRIRVMRRDDTGHIVVSGNEIVEEWVDASELGIVPHFPELAEKHT